MLLVSVLLLILVPKVSSLSADISCRMVLGKKYMEKEFHEKGFKPVIHEGMRLAASFNFGDYIPPIAPLDLQGLTKRMKAVGKVFDDFFEKIIDEHIQFKDENRTKDFVDVMLDFLGSEETEYSIGRDNIKAIILVNRIKITVSKQHINHMIILKSVPFSFRTCL